MCDRWGNVLWQWSVEQVCVMRQYEGRSWQNTFNDCLQQLAHTTPYRHVVAVVEPVLKGWWWCSIDLLKLTTFKRTRVSRVANLPCSLKMKATKWKSRRPENAELVLFLFRHSWPFVVVCESPSVESWVVRVSVYIYMGSIATLLLLTSPEQSRDNSCVEASNKQSNVERARKVKHWSHVESCEQKHLRCVDPQFGHLGFFRSVYIWQTSSHDLALTMIMFRNLP